VEATTDANGAIRIPAPLSGPVLALLGDSEFAGGDIGLGTSTPRVTNYAIQHWVKALSGQRVSIKFTDNYAVDGYTTANVISNKLASVVTAKPSMCAVLIGTNDICSSGVTITPAQLATVIANLQTIYILLLNAGITIIAVPILPRSYWTAGGLLPVAQQKQIAYVNQWIKNFSYSQRGMYVADGWPGMVDPATGRSIGDGVIGTPPANTAYTYDGLHPAPRGAYWVGKAIADIVSQLIPSNNTLRWSANDIYDVVNNPYGDCMSNGFLTTATGGTAATGASGTVAGDWTVRRINAGSAGAVVASVVTKTLPNGQTYNAQRMVVTAPAGSALDGGWMYQQQYVAGLIGKLVIAECAVDVSAITAGSFRGVFLECSDGTITCADGFPTSTFYAPDGDYSAILRTQPFILSAAVQQVNIKVGIDGSIASAGVTVDVSRIAFRVVTA
jgi:lysophospholipase L1-like esterase